MSRRSDQDNFDMDREDDFNRDRQGEEDDYDMHDETSVAEDNPDRMMDGLPVSTTIEPTTPPGNINSSGQAEADTLEIPASRVTFLEKNGPKVLHCAWAPTKDLFAFGCGPIARICDVTCSDKEDQTCQLFLRDFSSIFHKWGGDKPRPRGDDVSFLTWNCDGDQLAVSNYDGHIRIFDSEGGLKLKNRVNFPIFEVKWNKRKDTIAIAARRISFLLDVSSNTFIQKLTFHHNRILGVDWKSDTIFATCGMDKLICVCRVGQDMPIKTFRCHTKDVNIIQWNPQRELLASCSDDKTVKIWSLSQDTCVLDLQDHSKEVYALKWSQTGPGTANPYMSPILATGSSDFTVKLWDLEKGSCKFNLTNHTEPISSVDFSPDGKFLASGGADKFIHIWSTQTGELVRSYESTGDLAEVCWNYRGDKLGACCYDGSVFVLDLRNI